MLKNRNFRITVEGKKPVATSDKSSIDYESFERNFLFQNQLKRVTIEVEKFEIPLI